MWLGQTKYALLHELDKVFHPLEESDNPNHQEPASFMIQLLKGNGNWETRKPFFGGSCNRDSDSQEQELAGWVEYRITLPYLPLFPTLS